MKVIALDSRGGDVPKEKAAPIGAGAAFSLGTSPLLFGIRWGRTTEGEDWRGEREGGETVKRN